MQDIRRFLLGRKSTSALERELEERMISRASPAASPPAVLWQGLSEGSDAFDRRMSAVRAKLPAHVLLVVGCRPHPEPLDGVVLAELPDKLFELLHPLAPNPNPSMPGEPVRNRCAPGGRGSGKSHSFATVVVLLALSKAIRILCAREIMRSLRESVHHLISAKIDALRVGAYFHITDRAITCTATGAEIIFTGLFANVTQLKSLEDIGLCWIEEGESVSSESLKILTPTVRARGSELWFTLNPDARDAPVMTYVDGTRPDTRCAHVTFADNPWFPRSLEGERAYLQRVDDDAYRHVWLGECRAASDAVIFRGKYSVENFDPVLAPPPGERLPEGLSPWNGPYFGCDWGFSQDPTTLVRCWIGGRKLYVEHEAYALGCETIDLPALFDRCVPDARKYVTRADSARPETISYMQQHGYPRMCGVDKWSGSVEDGITFLRQFEQIVIHPRCTHTIEEMRTYSYKTDRLTGDVLPDVLDANNHTIDAIRYALGPLIRKPPGWGALEFARQEMERASQAA